MAVGGRSFFTPLHQAAWHGVPIEVAARLLDHGAWRSLRDAAGNRPADIARERGHAHLLDLLSTAEPSSRQLERYEAWDRHLESLVVERTSHLEALTFRSVPTEVVEVEGIDQLWLPYPGMYGGFSIAVYKKRLFVESWCRVVGGSGQAHVITEHGCTLVDEGFVAGSSSIRRRADCPTMAAPAPPRRWSARHYARHAAICASVALGASCPVGLANRAVLDDALADGVCGIWARRSNLIFRVGQAPPASESSCEGLRVSQGRPNQPRIAGASGTGRAVRRRDGMGPPGRDLAVPCEHARDRICHGAGVDRTSFACGPSFLRLK